MTLDPRALVKTRYGNAVLAEKPAIHLQGEVCALGEYICNLAHGRDKGRQLFHLEWRSQCSIVLLCIVEVVFAR